MSEKRNSLSNEWKPCPQGTLTAIARGQGAVPSVSDPIRRRQFVTAAAAVGVIGFSAVIVVAQLIPEPPGPRFVADGPVNCQQTVEVMWDYNQRLLDTRTTQYIHEHLEGCENCRRAYERNYSGPRTVHIQQPDAP